MNAVDDMEAGKVALPPRPTCRPPLVVDGGTVQSPAQKADEQFTRTLFALRDMRLEKDFDRAADLMDALGRQLRMEELARRQNEDGTVLR